MTSWRIHAARAISRCTLRRVGGWGFVLLACSALPAAAAPPDAGLLTQRVGDDERFLDGLRERRLFELAEAFCREQLARDDLTARRKALMTAEYAHTLSQRALETPPADRAAVWQRAQDVMRALAEAQPQSRWLPLLDVQGAIVLLAEGELLAQEADVGGAEDGAGAARERLTVSIRQLQTAADGIDAQLAGLARATAIDSADPNADELESLKANAAFHLGRVWKAYAATYPSASPDAIDALQRAARQFEPMAQRGPASALTWPSRIERVGCLRLLGQSDQAARQLDLIEKQDPPPPIELRATAERIRLLLAGGRINDAIEVARRGRRIDGRTSAELDQAHLELYLRAWTTAAAAGDAADAAEWIARAQAIAAEMQQRYGSYWGGRAGRLLAGYVAESNQIGDVDLLVRAAEGFYRGGQPDEAVAAYDRAADEARRQQDLDRAFDLAYTAAAIEHERNRHAAAAERFRELALSQPDHPRAGEAHLLAIYHVGQLWRAAPETGIDAYTRSLEEHLRRWPKDATADDARWQLGRLLAGADPNRCSEAIEQFEAIARSFRDFDDVVAAVAQCYTRLLGDEHAAGRPVGSLVDRATGYLTSLVVAPDARWPDVWRPYQRTAVLEAARIWINYASDKHADAARFLSVAMDDPQAPQAWRDEAVPLLVLALAASGRSREASEVLRPLTSAPPERLLVLIERLSQVSAAAPRDARAQIAEVQLRSIDMLRARRDGLDPAQRKVIDLALARALAARGRTRDAIAAYQSLGAEYARDQAIETELARLLLEAADPRSLKAALEHWRSIERGATTATPEWYEAKYYLALAHLKLGDTQRAAKIITVTAALHPDLGGPRLKAKFDELLRQAGG